MGDPLLASIYRLADRLHKTPQQIREDFTYEDFVHFLAHLQMTKENS